MRAGPSQEEIRRHNLGVLLRSVHVHGATSRAELTASLGLNRSTIGALTAELAAAGLVTEEIPRDRGRAGRPSLVVRPVSQMVYVLAFAIEADRVTAARVGLGGLVLDRVEAPRRPGPGPLDEVVAPLAAFARQMCHAAPEGSRHIGTGAAITPIVRDRDGQVRPRAYGSWADDPLSTALAEAVGQATRSDSPITRLGTADLAALAEHTRGVALGCANVVYLHGDAGIGGSIVAAGRPLTGHGGNGGEVGHMVVNPAGKPCGCGSRGCWETEVGEQALLVAAGRQIGTGAPGVSAVLDAAGRGDAEAQAAVRQVGDWLGFGVANLVNIFNPEMVVFGGTLREIYLASAAQVRSRLNRTGLPAYREHVRLRTSALGNDAPLLGAAEAAFEQLLADPLADVAGTPLTGRATGPAQPAESGLS
ncbi:MAG: ROK family transcriptional regulator [Dactylosporangium sp.]|nr:ROK family transcriptional regulator [Dactylosporangium sp.]NNJ59874.1 ROK family transcriptional regulator [Dactylosporangium sp.]